MEILYPSIQYFLFIDRNVLTAYVTIQDVTKNVNMFLLLCTFYGMLQKRKHSVV